MPAGAHRVHPGCASPSCRQNTPALPSGSGLAASLPIKEPSPGGRGTHSPPLPARHAIQTGCTPSALSSSPAPVGAAPGTTRSARTGRDCLATDTAKLPLPVYLGHTPPLRGLNHRGVSTPAPGTIPAPAEVPALAMVFDQLFTSVAGVTRRACRRLCGAPAPPRSPRPLSGAISPPRNQKLVGTRSATVFPCSVPSPVDLTGKGFPPLCCG